MYIYYKLTDSHMWLPFSSNYPNSYKEYTFCIGTSCPHNCWKHWSKQEKFRNSYHELKQILVPKTIECGNKKALSIPFQELSTPKAISNINSLLFITTYNPNNPIFYEMIQK